MSTQPMTTEQLKSYYERKAARLNKRAVELDALGDATSAENLRHYATRLLAKAGPRQTVSESMANAMREDARAATYDEFHPWGL